MLSVDLSNIWAQASLPELLELEPELTRAHQRLLGLEEGATLPAWWGEDFWAGDFCQPEIQAAAQQIRQQSQICLVLAPRGLSLGAQGVIQALGGEKSAPELRFVGDNFSTRAYNALLGQMEGKDVSLILLSAQGKEPEFAANLRCLRWLLERKYGTEEAARRIYAVTQEASGLATTAREQGWKRFSFAPEEPFGCVSPRWLLPLAVAGVDIAAFCRGAAAAREEYLTGSFENPLWLHAAVRNLLGRRGSSRELLVTTEPAMEGFARWWCHLFARDRVTPAGILLPRDPLPQAGCLATLLRFDPPEKPVFLDADWKNRDGMGHLEGKPLDHLEQAACQAVIDQADRGIPVLTMDCGQPDSAVLGELVAFFQLSAALSAALQEKSLAPAEDWTCILADLLEIREETEEKKNEL